MASCKAVLRLCCVAAVKRLCCGLCLRCGGVSQTVSAFRAVCWNRALRVASIGPLRLEEIARAEEEEDAAGSDGEREELARIYRQARAEVQENAPSAAREEEQNATGDSAAREEEQNATSAKSPKMPAPSPA